MRWAWIKIQEDLARFINIAQDYMAKGPLKSKGNLLGIVWNLESSCSFYRRISGLRLYHQLITTENLRITTDYRDVTLNDDPASLMNDLEDDHSKLDHGRSDAHSLFKLAETFSSWRRLDRTGHPIKGLLGTFLQGRFFGKKFLPKTFSQKFSQNLTDVFSRTSLALACRNWINFWLSTWYAPFNRLPAPLSRLLSPVTDLLARLLLGYSPAIHFLCFLVTRLLNKWIQSTGVWTSGTLV